MPVLLTFWDRAVDAARQAGGVKGKEHVVKGCTRGCARQAQNKSAEERQATLKDSSTLQAPIGQLIPVPRRPQ
jgi:hypothetical protein